MAKWTVEEMTRELQTLLGKRLVSVVLHGSAAAGDHAGESSDINLLVVTQRLKPGDLQSLSKAVVPWVKQGNPPPLFLTQEHLKDFVDVFPVEIADLQGNHRVLYGANPLKKLTVSHSHLRVELEHELHGKLLQLRSRFMMTEGKPKQVVRLMVESLSTFLILFKAGLRLYKKKPPLKKMEALRKLQERFSFDMEVFQTVDRLKRGETIRDLDPLETFEKYLNAIELITDKINKA